MPNSQEPESSISRRAPSAGSAHVWIVEMLDDNGRWLPTVGCRLAKPETRNELADWKSRNPCDRFRLTRYAPNDKLKRSGDNL